MVFVDEVVAVKHVDTVPRSISRDNLNLFILAEEHNVFQGFLLVREYASFSSCAGDDLEIYQMYVDGVRPAAAVVFELPDFDGASGGLSKDPYFHQMFIL